MTDADFRKMLRTYKTEPSDALAHEITKSVLRRNPVSRFEGMEGEYIKIRYDEGETGWAQDIGNNLARICNTPLTPEIRSGDIVNLVEGSDGWRTWDEVIERQFPCAAVLRYKDVKHFYVLSGACRIRGWSLEGGVSPSQDRPGFCSINYTEKGDLLPFLEKLGLKEHVIVNDLEDGDD